LAVTVKTMTEQTMARTDEVREREALRKLNGGGSCITQAKAEVGI
jgi:hypothetical protein